MTETALLGMRYGHITLDRGQRIETRELMLVQPCSKLLFCIFLTIDACLVARTSSGE